MPAGSPFPGPWKNSRAPWLVEPMDAFASTSYSYVVMMLASQMGKTEAGFNVLGWMWDSCIAPSIWVAPTQTLAYSLSRERLHQLFRSTPSIWDRMDQQYRKPGSIERFIGGVRFGLAWAGSSTELASHPCKFVIVDERSRMSADTGGEGDPVRIVAARTKMYAGSKGGVFSSPTHEEVYPTYRWWLTGTKMRWCWQCPGCGEWIWPSLERARYPDGASYDVIREEAWIECGTCQHEIRDADREGLTAAYIPSVLDDNGDLKLAPGLETRNSVASYWATGFASHVTGIGEIMEEYARASREGADEDLQAVVNTQAGELWRVPGESVPADIVSDLQTDVIGDVQLVTAGVDVQQDCLYYAVRGWCFGQTSYLLGHGQLFGATEYDDVWLALARVLEREYCGLSVRLALIDSGYNTAQVYEQCERHANWSPAKGVAVQDKAVRQSKVSVTFTGRPTRRIVLYVHSNDYWKTWLYARLKWPEGQPGGWYVPAGIDAEYCAQVTNERVHVSRGRREWVTTGNRRNHYMDAEILTSAAAYMCNVRTLRDRVEEEKPKHKQIDKDSYAARRQRAISEPSPFERRGL